LFDAIGPKLVAQRLPIGGLIEAIALDLGSQGLAPVLNELVTAQLLAIEVARLALIEALRLHLGATAALLDDVGPTDVATLDLHRATAVAVTAILEGESLALDPRRSEPAATMTLEAKIGTSATGAANGEITAAVATAPALHSKGCAATAARLDIAATVAAATYLCGALFAAMPAISAGLCARRGRNRQCSDARGKE
jgi:hypothetical protein